MIPGTTPTMTLTLRDESIDLSEAANVYFTISQAPTEITKSGNDVVVDGNVVQVWLDQRDTLRLRANAPAEIQLNWTYDEMVGSDHRRNATLVKQIMITPQLLRRVVS